MTLAYGSVCSGIEAASVAWHPLGWCPRFFCEVDSFASSVLSTHFPLVPNYGNLTQHTEWPDDKIDLLVGGTPCQSFSVAGLRRGMDDERGSLVLHYLGVARKYKPRWVVWENVPGVLSSGGGRDFGAFLGALGNLGYGYAYRVLDAQYFGVPQRRRRVFVVGYLGDWRRAVSVLFEPDGLRGHTPPRRKTRQDATREVEGGSSYVARDVAPCPTANYGKQVDSSDTGLGPNVVVHTVALRGREGGGTAELGGTVATALRASQGGGDKAYVLVDRVRRLTPVECERLQGFPDDWTRVGPTPKDGPRYKALGNSMAVPVMRWIGQGIDWVDTHPDLFSSK